VEEASEEVQDAVNEAMKDKAQPVPVEMEGEETNEQLATPPATPTSECTFSRVSFGWRR
jgi:hypothetical protein